MTRSDVDHRRTGDAGAAGALGAEHAALWCYSLAVAFLVGPSRARPAATRTCTASCAARIEQTLTPDRARPGVRAARLRDPAAGHRPGVGGRARWWSPRPTARRVAGAAGAHHRPGAARAASEGADRRHGAGARGGARRSAPRPRSRSSPAAALDRGVSAAHRAVDVVLGVVRGGTPAAPRPPGAPPRPRRRRAAPSRPGGGPRRSPSPRARRPRPAQNASASPTQCACTAAAVQHPPATAARPRRPPGSTTRARCRRPARRRRGAAAGRRRWPTGRPRRTSPPWCGHDRPAGAQRQPRRATRAEQPLVAAPPRRRRRSDRSASSQPSGLGGVEHHAGAAGAGGPQRVEVGDPAVGGLHHADRDDVVVGGPLAQLVQRGLCQRTPAAGLRGERPASRS